MRDNPYERAKLIDEAKALYQIERGAVMTKQALVECQCVWEEGYAAALKDINRFLNEYGLQSEKREI